ncbi:oxidoreductase, FAD/FMN-binding family protein [Trichomonas vaginalis G3]|uniref:Oxidoreductase, FAD/FMN-binding family protein n=1 Tax=Trichomonas vaginalis (strain ATCC PRA-98 / G3) TaxID=412133 RepID=A2F2H3_TRIV3|nr:FMN binding [Trichomonas vaginalis G3]EAY00873.1 oxidoreductase, FAD/FMN-binding family protein [Trichomonas vaginalis G3]KAI5489254.1 FMN binding [Trichomonas vaginalis G3]|eukprot:XP_001313802.1 oxidoreductase, FAD/FMN-binding family protein [Trichomonas vaginalis G3]
MDKLFSPVKVGSITIKNRFMRSPCFMNGCDVDGLPKPWLLKYYKDMADGQMGLIIPEYLYVQRSGRACEGQGGMENDKQAEAWKSTVDYMHKRGTKTLFQIADAGLTTEFRFTGERPRGPSPLQPGSRAMTLMEISEVIDKYRQCAKRLQQVGVDGIELHGAHGYLISSFLSPMTNHREDQYGGSPENRRRILVEIVDAIRKECGKDFVIGIKINGDDCKAGNPGIMPNDLAATMAAIPDMDLWEVSCGFQEASTTIRSTNRIMRRKDFPLKEGYNVPIITIVRKTTKAAIGVVGGIRKTETMIKALEEGADLISLGRPTIADTHVVQHIREGKKMKCISCGQCIMKGEQQVKCWI